MSYTEKEVVGMLKEVGDGINLYKGQVQTRLDSFDKELADLKKQGDAIETAVARGLSLPGGGSSSRADGPTTAAAREYSQAFDRWFRKGIDDGLRDLAIQASSATFDDPSGGFMVPEELSRTLDKCATATVAMRRLAQVIVASGNYRRLLSTGGAGTGWVGEAEARGETDTPLLREVNPPWTTIYSQPKTTQELADDSAFPFLAYLADEVGDTETAMEGAAFVSGNGVKQPMGFLSYPTVANANWAWGSIGYIASGHASQLNNADRLRSLKHSLKPQYRQSAVWLMNDSTQELIANWKTGQGDYIWKAGLTEAAPDTLLGLPVAIDDNLPNIGVDSFPIAIADWKRGYLIGDHAVGRRIIRDDVTEKGFIKLYVTKRLFGCVINTQAIKLMKIAVA